MWVRRPAISRLLAAKPTPHGSKASVSETVGRDLGGYPPVGSREAPGLRYNTTCTKALE